MELAPFDCIMSVSLAIRPDTNSPALSTDYGFLQGLTTSEDVLNAKQPKTELWCVEPE